MMTVCTPEWAPTRAKPRCHPDLQHAASGATRDSLLLTIPQICELPWPQPTRTGTGSARRLGPG